MATFLHRLGLGAVRHRLLVLGVWVLVLLGTGVGAATLAGSTVNTFEIPGQESTTALRLIDDRFGDRSTGASAQVVLQAPGDELVTAPENAAAVAQVVAQLQELDGVASATNPLDPAAPTVSPDQRAVYSTVTYGVQAPEITEAQREELLGVLEDARAAGLTAEATGEATQEVSEVGGAAEAVGVVAALVVLAITYGSLVAAGMNLLTALVGVGTGVLGITVLTGFVDLQSTTPILAVMLGLAVGIDYALFIVTRFRHELLDGRPVPEAAAIAVGTAGSAVLTAGLTVVIALAGLSVAGIPFLTEMGLAAAATVVVAVLVALTLVPAALGLIGTRALSRRARRALAHEGGQHVALPSPDADGRGFFSGWARTVTRHRWPSLLAAAVALAVVAVPVFSLRTTLNQLPPEDSTQARAAQLLSDRFGPGVTGPLLVLVDGSGAYERAQQVQAEVAELPGVALATPAQPNADGTAALVTVIPTTGPDDEATRDLVADVRARLARDAAEGTEAYVTGNTAVGVDVSQTLDEALPVYLVLVVGLALLLLVLVFRSLLVPLVGVLGFLLTIGSSLGATVAVFQWGWLKDVVNAEATGPLLSLAPIIVVGILFGLAMDYQVFLVSRMHEAHAHGADPVAAVRTGFRQAAPVVVAAAAIMFAVFAGFVPEGDATIKPIAFALAIGILADAVVVRMVLVPAALALLGRAAWWLPRWLRWLPALDVEGAALEHREAQRT
ncbi:MMPL family transporter [Paenibacillus sp. TRM 82003]|uniref:MMPL family transporter n=1 Tax=Kineococcus sp. TRM81007 TaxID=2925831 RepID=UPI001F58ED9C|nr:MMPL family transporter [Kineococcus sp. TRM81007]MCI2238731.1 MMPL family transporter [Kineococcus sp. TRM81007]MCI3924137.1 MMPL family transporter [Paenibacillus sp. TRM 82003]